MLSEGKNLREKRGGQGEEEGGDGRGLCQTHCNGAARCPLRSQPESQWGPRDGTAADSSCTSKRGFDFLAAVRVARLGFETLSF